MAPLENFEPLKPEEWETMSASRPRNKGTPKKGGYLVEDALTKEVIEQGKSFELQYSNPEEVEKMQPRLKARVGKGVRVLTDSDKPNSIFIGPDTSL